MIALTKNTNLYGVGGFLLLQPVSILFRGKKTNQPCRNFARTDIKDDSSPATHKRWLVFVAMLEASNTTVGSISSRPARYVTPKVTSVSRACPNDICFNCTRLMVEQ